MRRRFDVIMTLLLRHMPAGPSSSFSLIRDSPVGLWTGIPLHWRHNGCDRVSNHQPHDCLLNRLFRHRSKKTLKLRATGLCAGNSPVPGRTNGQWRGKCFHLMTSSFSLLVSIGSWDARVRNLEVISLRRLVHFESELTFPISSLSVS